MATMDPQVKPVTPDDLPDPAHLPELKIYSRSPLFYWWPVWAFGYAAALVTWMQAELVKIGGFDVWMHPSKNLGVFYSVVFVLIVLFTNITVRGMSSVVVVLGVLFLTVLFAWLGWWDDILAVLPYLAIFMNMGFYVFTSTMLLVFWLFSVLVYDRMAFWRVRPGQLTYERVIGGAEKSYDTRGMVLDRQNQDLFRHWILGLGSGDLRIATTGAHSEELDIPNVLFVNRKVKAIQKLISVKPDSLVEAHS